MALEGLSECKKFGRLVAANTPAEYISPFNQFSIPEIAFVAAIAGAPAFDAAATVEPAAAVPAGTPFAAFKGLGVLTAILSGSGAPFVLDLLMVR
jgi:hypothetical protein